MIPLVFHLFLTKNFIQLTNQIKSKKIEGCVGPLRNSSIWEAKEGRWGILGLPGLQSEIPTSKHTHTHTNTHTHTEGEGRETEYTDS